MNQCSAACSIDAATHSKRTGRSSISGIGSASVSVARSVSFSCRFVRVRASVASRPNSEPAKTSLRSMSSQVEASRCAAATDGSDAIAAPLIAPTDVPTTRSGTIPRSSSARSIPASCAPS